jgi:hypothetical protein
MNATCTWPGPAPTPERIATGCWPERIEGLVSQEYAKWAASSQQPTERPTGQQ